MTAPLSPTTLRRYAQEARAQGVVVTITAKGTGSPRNE